MHLVLSGFELEGLRRQLCRQPVRLVIGNMETNVFCYQTSLHLSMCWNVEIYLYIYLYIVQQLALTSICIYIYVLYYFVYILHLRACASALPQT
jgi:hypothetical protein